MLWAGATTEWSSASFRTHVVLERAFRVFAVERTGTLWDARIAPPRQGSGPGRFVIGLLLEGWMSWAAPALHLEGPSAFAATESSYEGESGARTAIFRSGGEPFRFVEVRLDPSRLTIASAPEPRAITVSSEIFDRGRSLLGALDHGSDPTEDVRGLMALLAFEGIVDRELAEGVTAVEAASIRRTWDAVKPLFSRLDATASLQDIAERSGVSLRQLARDIDELVTTFEVGEGFRGTALDLRLRWATLLLSVKELSLREVAKASGYGSVEALGRAFRDASLPSPTQARAILSEPAEEAAR